MEVKHKTHDSLVAPTFSCVYIILPKDMKLISYHLISVPKNDFYIDVRVANAGIIDIDLVWRCKNRLEIYCIKKHYTMTLIILIMYCM